MHYNFLVLIYVIIASASVVIIGYTLLVLSKKFFITKLFIIAKFN